MYLAEVNEILGIFSVPAAILAAIMLVLLAPTPVLAVPSELQATVGDVYVLSTITGKAEACVGGQQVVVPAVLELKCRVTEVGARFVLFRIMDGTLRLDQTTYAIVGGWWRGVYDKNTEKSLVEATATDGSGARIHFILVGDDARHTVGGTYMIIQGGLKDPQGIVWRLNIEAWRFRVA